MKVHFTFEARADLVEIGDYIAQDNAQRAATFAAELTQAARKLERIGVKLPLFQEYRHLGVKRFTYERYMIIFRIVGTRVEVLRIVHGSRDLAPIMEAMKPA